MPEVETTTHPTTSVRDKPEYSGPHRWQVQAWARFIRRTLRQQEYLRWVDSACTSVTVRGQDRLAGLTGPFILAPNHQSHMDTPVLMAGLPDEFRDNLYFGAAADRWFVKGKKKLILQPWYQSLAMGNFPIVRGGGAKALDHARWLLDRRCNLCIFPEGTRATSDSLGRFRHGVSLLAAEKQVPVVPVLLNGLRELRPKGARELTPGPVSVTFLDPLMPDPRRGIEATTELMWERMNRAYFRELPFPSRSGPSRDNHGRQAA